MFAKLIINLYVLLLDFLSSVGKFKLYFGYIFMAVVNIETEEEAAVIILYLRDKSRISGSLTQNTGVNLLESQVLFEDHEEKIF